MHILYMYTVRRRLVLSLSTVQSRQFSDIFAPSNATVPDSVVFAVRFSARQQSWSTKLPLLLLVFCK